MIPKRRNSPSLFLVFLIVLGCTDKLSDQTIVTEHNEGIADKPQLYYCKSINSWVRYQKDPYSLSNFQEAYDLLSSDPSTKSSFIDGTQLKATHYAIRIYPKTEEELSFIENMEDIKISYHPFDYYPVTISGETAEGNTISFEENPYKIVHSDIETSSGRHIDQESFPLPVLYVVWPINKPIPDSIHHKIDYEVFLPKYAITTRSFSSVEKSNLSILEEKAISLATGMNGRRISTKSDCPDSVNYKTLRGTITCLDNYSNRYLPLGRLLLVFQFGSNIEYGQTTADGRFDITTEIMDGANFTCRFSNSKWSIYYSNGSGPVETSFGTISSLINQGTSSALDLNLIASMGTPTLEIHRAADFYFNEQNEINAAIFQYPIKIYSYLGSNDSLGETEFPKNSQPYINIYNVTPDYDEETISTVLHELGHTYQFKNKGNNYDDFNQSPRLIQESFASYVGWHLVRQYYITQLNRYIIEDMSHNSRQEWSSSISEDFIYYSPLFVDLVDTYNQSLYYSKAPNDNIQGVPYALIDSVAINANCWNDAKSILESAIGVYYSKSDLDNYLIQYNQYFSNL